MFFTREDILKIQQALLQLGVKDSELPSTEYANYDDTLSIVQEGKNKQIEIRDFFNQISLWKREDFLNITDKYNKSYIRLLEAINLIPVLQRKDGLVITFKDTNGDWRIYQFRGNITEFLNKEKWFDLYDYRNYIVQSIVPDEEDLTASIPDENGNSLVHLKDRIYNPAIFNGKGYKFVHKNIINIELATIKINVTNPTTLEGNIDFNINNKNINVHLSPTIHNTTKLVAEAIRNALIIAYNDYEVTIVNSVVTLTRKYSGNTSSTTFEMYNTGVKVIVEDSTTIKERNIITQEDINKADTIYEIRYDFDLDGKTITIPKNCVLYFTSGKFYNGSINMDNTIVSTLYEDILSEVNISGNYYNIQKYIKDHQSQLDDKQAQIDDKQQQITANDEDISLLQTRSTQIEETIKSIAATGGASQATAVTYNNEKSKLTAINIQSAVDEIVDKTAIKDEEGTVVETPFRYIQNEEFIFAKVDAEDKLLFGIQWDGTPKFGKTSAVEDNLQSQVTLLAERVATIVGDGDTTNVIDTMNELKKFFAEIENTETLTGILANLDNIAKNLDKTTIKDEEGNVQDTPFRVIENEEFIMAFVDSDDRVLFGIYRDTGKPYYPQNDMYHISQSEEFLWVILDAANHPLLGIKQDGTCWAAKAQWLDDIKAIKEALSRIDETLKIFQPKEDGKGLINLDIADSFFYISNDEYIIAVVDAENRILAGIKYDGEPYFPNHEMYSVITNEEWLYAIIDAEDKVLGGFRADDGHMVVCGIDISTFIANAIIDIADIRERTAHLSIIDNDEYISVETDAEGKVIGYIAPDGSHYLYKVKSETIPTEFYHIEDLEGRTEITLDSNGNILKYRDKDGYLNECVGIKVSKKERERIASIFKKQNFRGYIDYSDEKFVEIPIPRSISKVNFVTSNENLPAWKGENLNGIIEFWDNDGNYFKKDISNFNVQGDTSQAMPWKNYGFDISDGSKIKFGNWIPCDSFHLKKYYLDCFRGQCIVAYRIAEQMYQTRTLDDRKPYQYLYKNDAIDNGNGIFEHDFYTGALCHPDGFPVKVYLNGKYKGIWVWALKKARDNYAMQKNNQRHILLDGRLGEAQLWGGSVDWTAFEIRNPKVKKDIEGNDYDGDNPKEPSSDYEETKGYIERLSHAISDINSQQDTESKKSKFKEYFKLNEIIDYFLFGNVFGDGDGFEKNWIWGAWDGKLWSPTYYDKDQIFGIVAWGENPYANPNTSQLLGTNENIPSGLCWALFKEDIKAEYKRLRDSGVFSVNNIIHELEKWIKSIGYNNLKDEIENICVDSNGVSQTPTYRPKNDKQGNPIVYSMFPHNGGFFNSVGRIRNWLESHFTYLDSTEVFDYK